eukprot:1484186-Prymnesium_polylepis.1
MALVSNTGSSTRWRCLRARPTLSGASEAGLAICSFVWRTAALCGAAAAMPPVATGGQRRDRSIDITSFITCAAASAGALGIT